MCCTHYVAQMRTIVVVLAHKDDREAPEGCNVVRLKHLPLVCCTVAITTCHVKLSSGARMYSS